LRHKGVDVLRGVRSNYRGGLMILLNGSTGGHWSRCWKWWSIHVYSLLHR
jgi:hypothetical protein